MRIKSRARGVSEMKPGIVPPRASVTAGVHERSMCGRWPERYDLAWVTGRGVVLRRRPTGHDARGVGPASTDPIGGTMRALRTLVVVAPLVLLGLLLVAPAGDLAWENHPAHFWLVLTTAMVCVGLGGAVGAAARRRRDSRTVLIALACTTAAGFLGLHALATPGVLLGSNPGFELATPVGLAMAGVIAAISAVEFGPPAADRILQRSGWLLASTLTAMGVWAAASLAELPPLDRALSPDEVDGWQVFAGHTGRRRVRGGRGRIRTAASPTWSGVSAVRRACLCAAGRGNGRDHARWKLEAFVVGVAPADGDRVCDRRGGCPA
jgi:hypothetical protein